MVISNIRYNKTDIRMYVGKTINTDWRIVMFDKLE